MINLMLGDCLERMKEIEDGSVDLTVTSPPYDNLRTYNDTLTDWNADKWQWVLRELFRVTKEGGVVVWIVADATIKGSETGTSFRQALYAMDCGFRLHDTMIWHKSNAMPQVARCRQTQAFEYMFVFSKNAPKTVHLLMEPCKLAGRVIKNTNTNQESIGKARRSVVTRGEKISSNIRAYVLAGTNHGHPAIFPEALARDHILSWSNPGDTVFDPFLGSGTTGVACVKTNRKFIGIERDETYFNIAKDRINRAIEEEKWKLI